MELDYPHKNLKLGAWPALLSCATEVGSGVLASEKQVPPFGRNDKVLLERRVPCFAWNFNTSIYG